jgi:hypothetical protein
LNNEKYLNQLEMLIVVRWCIVQRIKKFSLFKTPIGSMTNWIVLEFPIQTLFGWKGNWNYLNDLKINFIGMNQHSGKKMEKIEVCKYPFSLQIQLFTVRYPEKSWLAVFEYLEPISQKYGNILDFIKWKIPLPKDQRRYSTINRDGKIWVWYLVIFQ